MKDRGFFNGGQTQKGHAHLVPKANDFKQSQKHKHLGGKGLSLPAFANAKSKTAYNPAELKKQREYYKNAKNVKKYRKLLKHLGEGGHSNQDQIDTSACELNQETESEQKQKSIEHHSDLDNVNNNRQALSSVNQKVKKAKNDYYQKNKGKNYYNHKEKGKNNYSDKSKNTLQKLREDYEMQKQEEEVLRKEREAAIALKREAQEKAESKRRDLKMKMCKKTRSGQPIMKFRMDHLLDRIQNSN
ncbi:rRNA-processing protein FYV7 [Cryptomeria japonica]|uniref:rRNA-processing protein FYV7 n=1 Tax=Cryptomeria japonica TaxID=3369 RepID=UPI0027DA8E7F|nr:rRNA-processing protein FYV7 [Cryptomeria japonica]